LRCIQEASVTQKAKRLHIPNEINQLGFFAGKADHFHVKDNDSISGNAGLSSRRGTTLVTKSEFALWDDGCRSTNKLVVREMKGVNGIHLIDR